MNSQIKQQWVTALRSNEYSQTQGNLRSPNGFCCLGVLCDVYAKQTGNKWIIQLTEDGIPFTYYYFDEASITLPESVKKWAGLDMPNPLIKEELSLAELNDAGKTFEEIAQLIDENF
jgi:hypothetical protein